MSDDSDFQSYSNFDTGATDCYPVQAGSIKKGSYCLLKGNPCKVTDTATSKPGKHGSAKIHITGTDLFTGKKYDDIFYTGANIWVPNVGRTEYEVADISDDGFVSLLEKDGSLKEDIKLPADAELAAGLKKCWEENNNNAQVYFTMITACGNSKFISFRIKEIDLD